MKKRIISIILMLSLCFTLIPASLALAAEEQHVDNGTVVANDIYSPWAEKYLIVGDTYGMYPTSWYEKGMTRNITPAQLQILLAGIRGKLLNTGLVTDSKEYMPPIGKAKTVEEILNVFYGVLSSYTFSKDIGLMKRYSPTAYMAEYGVFTGEEGELSYSDRCTIEQACVIATRLVTYVYDALEVSSKGFLWEAKQGDNTVYMLGSIHMASNDIYPFSNKMLDAFAKSDALAVELNILDPNASYVILQYGMYADGTTLKDHVSEETYLKTVELAVKIGYTEEQIAMFKPWCVYSLFTSISGTTSGSYDEASTAAALGIDLKFTMDAMITGKPILEIEGYVYQAMVLDSFSDELEEYILNDTIDSVNEVLAGTATSGADSLNTMLDYWKTGDVEAFKEYIAPSYELPSFVNEEDEKAMEMYAEYEEKLMKQRDIGMAEYIDQLLKAEGSATYFVVVGSAHYISDYSVLDILKEKGYEINQIK